MPVSTIQAAGNSQAEVNYSNFDNSPFTGKSYYRLKMIDMDGHSEFSAVRIVLLTTQLSARIIGNPVHNKLEVVTSAIDSFYKREWIIINAAGRLIKKGNSTSSRTEIDVSALSPGTYWLKISTADLAQTIPFIRQ